MSHWISRRSPVFGTHAMIASRKRRHVNSRFIPYLGLKFSQPLANQAGLEILKKGGNAAVTTGLIYDIGFLNRPFVPMFN
ncbi:hypothetical protein BC938DRAFT_475190 [Jimgerdemannia flammicorona]|uniref:Uncharacterized protein n=1 Tax=Jimgerdemannia flammicorona TaxID=994334 RepID=A0A433QRZ2_9FUNG|nr:hypothetical protein BC938DRAFT_475190 [Jimgerdemannia flammicorona]